MLEFPPGFVNTRLNSSQVLVCHPKTRKYYLFSAGFNPFVFEILQVTGSPQGNLSYFNRHECVSSVRISVFLKFQFLRCCQALDKHSLEKSIPSASFRGKSCGLGILMGTQSAAPALISTCTISPTLPSPVPAFARCLCLCSAQLYLWQEEIFLPLFLQHSFWLSKSNSLSSHWHYCAASQPGSKFCRIFVIYQL